MTVKKIDASNRKSTWSTLNGSNNIEYVDHNKSIKLPQMREKFQNK